MNLRPRFGQAAEFAGVGNIDDREPCLIHLEADLFGKAKADVPYACPLITMSMIRFLETFSGPKDGPITHPPAADRRKRLLTAVADQLPAPGHFSELKPL